MQPKQWALTGSWLTTAQNNQLTAAPGKLSLRFKAQDLYLVMGATDHSVHFRRALSPCTFDGHAPHAAQLGPDLGPHAQGVVSAHRLYRLLQQVRVTPHPQEVVDNHALQDAWHDFTIEFLEPRVEVFSFTFG